MSNEQQGKGRKPHFEWRSGNIKLAVWEEEKVSQGGEKYMQYSMVLSKSFKREGEKDWTEQKMTLFAEELPTVETLLRNAFFHVKVDFRSNP
jgi:hypothetical protein